MAAIALLFDYFVLLTPTMTALIQRPLRGSRISSFYPIKSLPPLASLDSAFQLQEYISLLIRLDVHDVDHIVAIPGKTDPNAKAENKPKDTEKKADKEVVVDQACWIYEQLRLVLYLLIYCDLTTEQSQATRAGPHSSSHNDPSARMHASHLSRDESWRMALFMCRPWHRRRHGGT